MAETPAFTPLDEGGFHARLSRVAGVAVVLFSTPHCGACRAWKAVLPKALGDTAAQFFEVDVAQATGIARYYDIFHLPTIYLYRDGHFHAELQAEARIDAIRAATQGLLAAPAQEEP
ncbi:MAG: thioredoxin family protein [Thiobacillaceae bacterium]|jgi:thioredoxin-like negative regulator of GroEL|nr:thioredoxin family protein [Thiobacillaceae bacterium]